LKLMFFQEVKVRGGEGRGGESGYQTGISK
jgi:hypothetical protein